MFSIAAKIFSILNPQERQRAIVLFGLILLMGFFEMLGVAAVVPFISLLADPTVVQTNQYLKAAYDWTGFGNPDRFLFLAGLLLLLILLGSIAFRAFVQYAITRFTSMRSFSISSRLVGRYLTQPYEWFLNRNSADLGKTILTEVDQMIRQAMMPLANLISGIVTAVFILGLLFWADPKLSISVALILGTAYVLIYSGLRPTLTRLGQERVANNRMKYQVVSEAFGGIKEIKVGGLETIFFRRFQGPARNYARSEAIAGLAASLPRYLLEGIAFGGMLSIALYLMSSKGNLAAALPILALYALAGYRLMPILQQVYGSAVQIRYAAGAVDNLYDDFQNHPAQAANSSGETSRSNIANSPVSLTDKIELDQVSYRYPTGSKNSLNQLSLTIPANHTVGFVGPTGSGKTTTVDLILGLLMPSSGQLRVDGRPITAGNVGQWQRSIGYVPQQIYLADDTVAGNIAFGIPEREIDLEAVRLAARIANLDEFVSKELPQGYATMIGERGIRLSGGQRQRIGIARALYHRPSVLVMDEATSALDNLTEEGVMQAIEELNRQMTIILIAHRLTTVKKCDTIFLLEAGCLVGQGSYEELVGSNERFRAMSRSGK